MGLSGSGKTTLLTVLTGRYLKGMDVRGGVFLNGNPADGNTIVNESGYVQQNDLFEPVLTVREHLIFHSLLRMDQGLTKVERERRVDSIIEKIRAYLEVKPNDCLLHPNDEPTSGLDSFMAKGMIEKLKSMASEGRTVICTIHQPSSQVFALFEHLLLLVKGRVAFMGETGERIRATTGPGPDTNATAFTAITPYQLERTFCGARPLFLREHHNRMYRVVVYFIAQNIVDLPIYLLQTILFVFIYYFMVGLNADFTRFLTAMAIVILISQCAISYSITTSAWVKYFYNLSWFYYGFEALVINQWNGIKFDDCPNKCNSASDCISTGQEVIEKVFDFREDHLGRNIRVLATFVIGFRLLAFLVLYCRSQRQPLRWSPARCCCRR
ncbi:unnamed protein product [Oppiella nova]|uniref:ABC transporter domain-containing protein n=1 Tax=Oppiella nova TaxID=334625 RepID=A0A7R9LRR1_9ACAR|nr:unnamed protein product [Oppiella nova]CAG2166312.1 unnamed protein product [Oppiella nova]